jgi:D-glycero-beta-D-manno-heptose-7-phosphate kinase
MSMPGILARFRQQRILVVGDVMLDEYIWGSVRRISPEAPVPIVEITKRSHVPGGAANAAANVAGLGANVDLLGIVGADEAGGQLRHALERMGIRSDYLLDADIRPTTAKTRVIAHGQQVVRVDHEQREAIPAPLEERLVRVIDDRLRAANACVLSDYAKGLVSPRVAGHLLSAAAALGKPVIVDPKGADYSKYRGATLVKPNLLEAGHFLGREVDAVEDVVDAGRRMLAFLGSAGVLITRGAAGMSLFEKDADPLHIPTQAREVYDVTGAGDTVVGTLAVALAAGAGLAEAARLASRAAGIIVGHVGTTAITLDELQQVVQASD